MMFKNEFRCLTNAVLQSCIRNDLYLTWGLVPLVRQIVRDNGPLLCNLENIAYVRFHQEPKGQGFVDCLIEVVVKLNGGPQVQSFSKTFQISSLSGEASDYLLYDQHRDGVLEHVHLVH